METVRESLLEMGFPEELVDKSLSNTQGSIDQAIEWIENATGENEQEADSAAPKPAAESETLEENRSSVEARLSELKKKAAAKREERAKAEAIEQRKNSELMRRSQQETREAARLLEVTQAKKMAEQRKREAITDREYREKLRREIELDKLEREAQRKHSSGTSAQTSSSQLTAPTTKPVEDKPKTSTMIRLRIQYAGKSYTKSYVPTTTVEELGSQLQEELEIDQPFQFRMLYPKMSIRWETNTETLQEAGLANANIIIV